MTASASPGTPEQHPGQRPGVLLGIDLGSVRIGVARTDPDRLMAVPVETLRAGDEPAVARAVADLVAEYEATGVVVGLPRSLSGSEGPAARRAHRYAVAIARGVAPVPVRLVDERMTTTTAHHALRTAGVGGRKARGVVDQVAATVILQAALDADRASGRTTGTLVAPDEVPTHRSEEA